MEKRVQFDFHITFENGGSLRGEDFRLDIPGDYIANDVLAELVVQDLRLLMVATVTISNRKIITEAHKRRPEMPASR